MAYGNCMSDANLQSQCETSWQDSGNIHPAMRRAGTDRYADGSLGDQGIDKLLHAWLEGSQMGSGAIITKGKSCIASK